MSDSIANIQVDSLAWSIADWGDRVTVPPDECCRVAESARHNALPPIRSAQPAQ